VNNRVVCKECPSGQTANSSPLEKPCFAREPLDQPYRPPHCEYGKLRWYLNVCCHVLCSCALCSLVTVGPAAITGSFSTFDRSSKAPASGNDTDAEIDNPSHSVNSNASEGDSRTGIGLRHQSATLRLVRQSRVLSVRMPWFAERRKALQRLRSTIFLHCSRVRHSEVCSCL